MIISVLGWGSLLWEHAPAFDRWREEWQYDGPILPLEFSRISESRRGALTLVIDPETGGPTRVAWCRSKRTTVEDAVADIRCREGTTLRNIGSCVLGKASARPDGDVQVISEWAVGQRVDAVVWTALSSNFQEKRNEKFSVEAAIRYLAQLPSEGKVKAAEYIWRAPDFVVTPVRLAIQIEPWFVGV